MSRSRTLLSLVAGLVLTAACEDLPTTTAPDDPAFATAQQPEAAAMQAVLDELNAGLAATAAEYRALSAEYITHWSSHEAGATVIAKDVGNKQLGADFVPHDVRREPWSGPVGGGNDNITYAIDTTIDAVPPFGGLTAAQTDAAIERAMNTWQGVRCSTLDLTRFPDFGIDIGLVAFQNGFGGSPFVFADLQHAGWRDIDFAGSVLGVTFTFVFTDDDGNPTDINNDGKADVAFREIYYDPSWFWADDGVSDVDVQSVAVHEAGHGLSQAHFGTIRIKNNGELKASPRAVMNALYAEPFRELKGTDNGGHCSIWANWPRR